MQAASMTSPKTDGPQNPKTSWAARAIGVFFTLAGLLANPWILGALFAPDDRIESTALRGMMFVVQAILLVPGIFLLGAPRTFRAASTAIRRFPNLAATLFGAAIASALVLVGLVVLEWLGLLPDHVDTDMPINEVRGAHQDTPFWSADPLLGYVPRANAVANSRLIHDGEELYNVVYTIDAFRRRVTPHEDAHPREKFALFFGGSFAFGEGVPGDQTLPAHFARMRPEYRAYNYAFSGYGPQHMLARLQETDIEHEVSEKRGILVYVFINDHVNRAIGAMSAVNNSGAMFPYYALDGGRLVRLGSFRTGRPVRTHLYHLLSLAAPRELNLPVRRSASQYRLTARIIEESAETFRSKFASLGVYVILYPAASQGVALVAHLESTGIRILDYSSLINLALPEYQKRFTAHPTGLANAEVTRQFIEDLQPPAAPSP